MWLVLLFFLFEERMYTRTCAHGLWGEYERKGEEGEDALHATRTQRV